MSVTYEWKITNLSVILEYRGLQNVVRNVQYTVTANVDGVERSYKGICHLRGPSENFIQYDSLTESDVIGWVHAVLGPQKNTIEEKLAVVNKPTAKMANLPLPWGQ